MQHSSLGQRVQRFCEVVARRPNRFGDGMTYDEIMARAHRFDQVMLAAVFLLNPFISAAVTYGVVMQLQGRRASIGTCIGVGFGRFFPVLGVTLLSTLLIGAGFCM